MTIAKNGTSEPYNTAHFIKIILSTFRSHLKLKIDICYSNDSRDIDEFFLLGTHVSGRLQFKLYVHLIYEYMNYIIINIKIINNKITRIKLAY